MKKVFVLLLVLGLAAFMMIGCGNGEEGAAVDDNGEEVTNGDNGEAQDSDEERTLIISNWGFGEDALIENIFRPFEEEHNVNIVLDTGNNSERLIQVRTNPNHGVDLIYLAQSFAQEGFDEGLFKEIDYSRLPNAEYMHEQADIFKEEGQGPAYTVNRMGIIYNPEAIDFEITSFEDLWKPELAGKISIPEISTTFGPAMVYAASDKAGVDITTDQGDAAFEALADLNPNIVNTYTRSSDLVNMMASGEIVAAVAAEFAFGAVVESTPSAVFLDPSEGPYLNFNTINIVEGTENEDLAYEFIDYLLSEEVQHRAALNVPDSPINTQVELTDEEAQFLTYQDQISNANTLDFTFVNEQLDDWVDRWNRTLNQ